MPHGSKLSLQVLNKHEEAVAEKLNLVEDAEYQRKEEESA